jgi:tubulin--tyrosine ligase-like protein 12
MFIYFVQISVFLIDHAWTYELKDARQNLDNHPNLLNRMANIMSIEAESENNQKIDDVLENMWKFNQTYKLSSQNPVI